MMRMARADSHHFFALIGKDAKIIGNIEKHKRKDVMNMCQYNG